MTSFDETTGQNNEVGGEISSAPQGAATVSRPIEVVHGIVIDRSRDDKITPYGKKMMNASYLLPGESYQDRFACVAR